MNPLTLENIRFRYSSHSKGVVRDILKDVTLDVPAGKTFGLIGPNGSGKSTLLRCIYRALRPQGGRIFLLGQEVQRYTSKSLSREVAVAVQQEEVSVPLTTMEYILLGRSAVTSAWRSYSVNDRSRAEKAIRDFGLENMKNQSVLELSGGECKRAMLARTLIQDTPVLLLDEPTNHLDIRFQHQILRLVKSLEKTSVIVLHDLNLAARYCDYLALLDNGELVAVGAAEEILTPELLEPVYGLDVHCMDINGHLQLLMAPQEEDSTIFPRVS